MIFHTATPRRNIVNQIVFDLMLDLREVVENEAVPLVDASMRELGVPQIEWVPAAPLDVEENSAPEVRVLREIYGLLDRVLVATREVVGLACS